MIEEKKKVEKKYVKSESILTEGNTKKINEL